jgi:hypothetical protein
MARKWPGKFSLSFSFVPILRRALLRGSASKPIIAYSHRTANAETGAPMHRESGFMKLLPEGKFVWTIAQATGMAEVADGSWNPLEGMISNRLTLQYNRQLMPLQEHCT